MNTPTEFPKSILPESLAPTKVEINGQKVVFDKKVSLFPVELKKNVKINYEISR